MDKISATFQVSEKWDEKYGILGIFGVLPKGIICIFIWKRCL